MENTSHEKVLMILGELKNIVEGTNRRLDTLNGSVIKQEQRLANQDILNAQITITQGQMVKDLDVLKTNDKTYNDFRISFMSSLNTFKWLFGILGIGNVVIFLKVVVGVF